MGFDEIDMGERGCDLRSSRSPPDIHLDPKLSLKSKIFVESLMPEVFRAMGLKRVRAGGYAQIVSCVLANLVKAGERSVIVRLGYHARYEGLAQKQLIRALPVMADLGWVELMKGQWQGEASTIKSTGKLDLAGLETMKEPKECLVIRKKGKPVNFDPHFTQEEIGQMKAELRELNHFLETADISWGGPSYERPDLSQRDLRRIFNVVEGMYEDEAGIDLCGFGRLYGPFWVNLEKAQRASIMIEGESLAYLDFNSMNVHLGYFLAGELPPPGDLYNLTDFLCSYEDKPEWRKPVKKFLNSIWFCQRKQWPRDIWFPGDTKKKRRFEYNDVYRAIVKKHPDLKRVFTRPLIGFQMARLESDILIDILLRLKARGIVGLSVHDGLLVAQSQVGAARQILDGVTQERLGFRIPYKTELLEPTPNYSIGETIDLSSDFNSQEEITL
jgi:hypothetical protein